MTERGIKTLRSADIIAAEDTRHTLKLLSHFGISKPMVSYWGEKEKLKSAEVMAILKEGKSVALVTDAGTPGISDPGAVLISEAVEAGCEIIPIPGASALTAALSVSGLSTLEFTFIGFLPAKEGARKKKLEDLRFESRTLVFYESPHRLIDSMIDMENAFGTDRRAALCKEITKMHEHVERGTLNGILDSLEHAVIAGEYVIVVEGFSRGEATGASVEEAVKEVVMLMKKGLGRKEAAKAVAAEYGMSKKELYDKSLSVEK